MKRCNDLCVRICANTILRVTAYVDIVEVNYGITINDDFHKLSPDKRILKIGP